MAAKKKPKKAGNRSKKSLKSRAKPKKAALKRRRARARSKK